MEKPVKAKNNKKGEKEGKVREAVNRMNSKEFTQKKIPLLVCENTETDDKEWNTEQPINAEESFNEYGEEGKLKKSGSKLSLTAGKNSLFNMFKRNK